MLEVEESKNPLSLSDLSEKDYYECDFDEFY